MENLSLNDISIVNLARKLNTKEKFIDTPELGGIALIVVILLLFLIIGLWIWALYALIHFWSVIPTWAKVIGVIGIIPVVPFGPIITLVVVYATKKQN